MATHLATLAKIVDNETEFIYPRTTSEIVQYTDDMTVKEKLDELEAAGGLAYGVCDTAEDVASKTVSTNNTYNLVAGGSIVIKFTYTNTADNPTLDVNETGAKSIMRYGDNAVLPYTWQAGEILELTYDGTNYIIEGGSIASTTYYGATKLEDGVESESTTTAATPNAVKTAYDAAIAAQSAAEEAMQTAEADKYTHPTVEADDTTSEVTTESGGTFTAIDTVNRDECGHVTGVNTKTIALPEDVIYTAGTGIEISSDNVINHSNSITAGTVSGSSTGTLAFDGSFEVPSVTYDGQGHITETGTTTLTMPSISDSVTSTDSTVAASSAAVKTAYDAAIAAQSTADQAVTDAATAQTAAEAAQSTADDATTAATAAQSTADQNASDISDIQVKLDDYIIAIYID